jgi:hypothetical protein
LPRPRSRCSRSAASLRGRGDARPLRLPTIVWFRRIGRQCTRTSGAPRPPERLLSDCISSSVNATLGLAPAKGDVVQRQRRTGNSIGVPPTQNNGFIADVRRCRPDGDGRDVAAGRSRSPPRSHFTLSPHQPGPRHPGRRGWPWRDIGRGEQHRAGGGARSALRCLTRRRCLNGAQRSEFGDAPPDRAAERSRAKGAARSRPRPLARQGQPRRPGSRGLPRRPLRQPLRHREAHRAAGIAEHKETIPLSAENRKNVGNCKGRRASR